MIGVFIILFVFAFIFLILRTLKIKHVWLFAIFCTGLIFFIHNLSSDSDGYEGDLVPIKSEIDNITGYEKAVKLIRENKAEFDAEAIRKTEHYKETGRSSGESYLRKKLDKTIDKYKLRFPSYEIKTEGKDTIVTFEGTVGEHYIRGNNKDEDACCTLFEHSITYSTKPLKEFRIEENANDTPSAVIKIKVKYYYNIYSRLEY